MSAFKRLRRRMWAYFAQRAIDAELEAELEAHLDMAIDENLERGLSPAEARRAALASIGGVQQTKERHREARGIVKLDILLQDVRYTLRTLRRDPSFTIVAIVILALAIGANVAVFSVVNALLLRPLPFPHAEELAWLAPPPQKCGLSCSTFSTDAYDEFRTSSRTYQDITGYFAFSSPGNLSLNGGGAPIPATGIDVIANFFTVLGVQPARGRLFRPDDARNNAPPVIVITDAWWRTQFNADPEIVGKAFDINGRQTTVIGVLQPTFDFGAVFSPGSKVDAITPLNLYGPPRDWGNIITFIGRMKPGVTLAQATEDAKQAAPHMCWNNRYPNSCGTYKDGVAPIPLKDYVSGKLRRSLVVLWSAVGAILLIACVNLSNLLLARASARGKEFAMRGALGATRLRIVYQLLTESLILSSGGAIFGLALAVLLVFWLSHQSAIALPLLTTLHVDLAALGWTVMIAVFAAIFFGLVPGLRMASGNLHESLKDSGPGSGMSRKHERVRAILVVSEVALACMLLVGAGLLLRSFMHVLDVDLGFEPSRAASINAAYDDNAPTNQASSDKRRETFQQMIERVSRIPGVEAAGIVDYLPLGPNRAWGTPFPKGVTVPDKLPAGPLVYVVTPGYLRAMGTRIRGRDFAWSDDLKGEPVIMVSESYARFMASYAHWPNNDAVGQELANGTNQVGRVIAVVDDVHEETTEGATGWQIYYSAVQQNPSSAELVVRSQLPPSALGASVLMALRELNPKQPAAEFKPVQTIVDHANSPRRFFLLLVTVFAVLGLLLAALGIYGVISYSVTRQTQEIGIRMALGATAGRVQKQILSATLRLVIVGIVIGCSASIAGARMIGALLYGTSPWDLATYSAVGLVLLLVAAVAGYVPAWRASRISPMVALRTS